MKSIIEEIEEDKNNNSNNLTKADMYSPLVWAYIGDAVYELRVRERLIEKSYAKPHTLHLRSIKLVNAKKQARILEGLEETLTEEEKTIARRARNTKNFHVPKGTSVAEYAKSTALEAVIGYHNINGNEKRKEEILDKIIMLIEESS